MVFILGDHDAVFILGAHQTLGRHRRHTIMLKEMTCSKNHAEIEIREGNVFLWDVGSKRGTFVNEKQIDQKTRLQSGDIVRFGLNDCMFKFCDPNFKTVTDGTDQEALKEALKSLNIPLLRRYCDECSHYTIDTLSMDSLKNTAVLDAIIDKKLLVNSKFWIFISNNQLEAIEMPNMYKFFPEIADDLMDKGVKDIQFRIDRRNLFKNKLFIFFDENLEKELKHLINKCAGETIIYSDQLELRRRVNGYIFVTRSQHEETILAINNFTTASWYIKKLRAANKNVCELTENDIYFSILHGSLNISRKRDTIEINSTESEKLNQAKTSVAPPTVKNTKRSKTTLNRWISKEKLNYNDSTVNQTRHLVSDAKSLLEFDISMDMNSSSSEEIRLEQQQHESLIIIDSDSDREELQKQTKHKDKSNDKVTFRKDVGKKDFRKIKSTKSGKVLRSRNKPGSTIKLRDEADLPSTCHETDLGTLRSCQIPESEAGPSGIMREKQGNNQTINSPVPSTRESSSSDNSEIITFKRKTSRRQRQKPTVQEEIKEREENKDRLSEDLENVTIKSPSKPSKLTTQQQIQKRTAQSKESKEFESLSGNKIKKKRLKINPFALLKNTSTPKRENLTLENFKKYKDVEFIPLYDNKMG